MLRLKKDRRRYERTPIELVINCFLPTLKMGQKDRFKCYARDISPKGIKLVVPGELQIGDEIVLLLEKPIARTPLLVKGRTRWIKEEESSRQGEAATQIGVEFIHLSTFEDHERHKLDRLIKEVEANNRLIRES